jgi:hypothetical protein
MGTGRRAWLGWRSGRRLAAATAAVLALAACTATHTAATSSSGHGGGAASPPGQVIALNHITTLRTLFNRDAGHPRLVMIFSPT